MGFVLFIVQALTLNFTLFINQQLWLELEMERMVNDQKLGGEIHSEGFLEKQYFRNPETWHQ